MMSTRPAIEAALLNGTRRKIIVQELGVTKQWVSKVSLSIGLKKSYAPRPECSACGQRLCRKTKDGRCRACQPKPGVVEFICAYCGKPKTVRMSQYRRRKPPTTCSHSCSQKLRWRKERTP